MSERAARLTRTPTHNCGGLDLLGDAERDSRPDLQHPPPAHGTKVQLRAANARGNFLIQADGGSSATEGVGNEIIPSGASDGWHLEWLCHDDVTTDNSKRFRCGSDGGRTPPSRQLPTWRWPI